MEWYYADGREAVGPLGDEELESLVSAGKITASTLVWHKDLKNWQQYGQTGAQKVSASSEIEPAEGRQTSLCLLCGEARPLEEMSRYGDSWVCQSCKPPFLQKLTEGIAVAGALDYAGFWRRLVAKCIDGIILWLIGMIFAFGAGLVTASRADFYQTITLQIFFSLVQILLAATYATWFVGTYGATPGKMALHLRIVTPEGTDIGYMRALGRHFAEWVSTLILMLGYVMAAFDSEKRTLHDRMCNTRVIRTRYHDDDAAPWPNT